MRTLFAVLVAVVAVLAGCGESPDGSATKVDLDFAATTLAGDDFDGGTLEGKPVVLWFWAPWCSSCRAQSGTVDGLAEKYEGRVEVVGVGGLDDAEAIRDMAENLPHLTHLVDDAGTVWKHFKVVEQSTFEIISADGEVVAEGHLDDDELAAVVGDLAG
ncbi:MAG: redoxin domain-containing protein [Aeromicrobium sp.]